MNSKVGIVRVLVILATIPWGGGNNYSICEKGQTAVLQRPPWAFTPCLLAPGHRRIDLLIIKIRIKVSAHSGLNFCSLALRTICP